MTPLIDSFRHYRWLHDTIDIVVVAVVIYNLLVLIKGTRAFRMLAGILTLVIVSVVSRFLDLRIINWALTNFFEVFVLAIIILFQPELRRALAQMGKNPFHLATERYETRRVIQEIVKGATILSNRLIGGLITVQRETDLTGFIEGGVTIGGEVSRELLVSIFLPYSPIHDGAVVVRRGKIIKAGCFLPLSMSAKIGKELGTRHRAALGLAEETDALVVVVSEETGNITVAMDGALVRVADGGALKDLLESHLVRATAEEGTEPLEEASHDLAE